MKRVISCLLSLSISCFAIAPLHGVGMRAAAGEKTAGTQVQTNPAAPPDGGWPRAYDTASGAKFLIYEPQVASWTNQKRIVLYAAVSYWPKDQARVLGTIRVEADTRVAVPERLVSFSDFEITSPNFPTIPQDQLNAVVSEFTAAIPRSERVIGLDRVLAALDASQVTPKNVDGVKADPPVVFFSENPAVLVNIDGEPILSPIKDNELRFAVNTNWDLFVHEPSQSYYLRIESSWLRASSVSGPWTAATKLPAAFSMLPDDPNWKEVKAALPLHATASHTPTVFVSTRPAELILLTGPPAYVPVKDTRLEWVSNTDSDVFRLGKDGAVYYLVSGRWFTAPGFTGPWTFATPNLPEDFKRIPLEHPRSRVLASVPGTTQALEAVLLASIPQTAVVKRNAIEPPDVAYQGEPQFEAIQKTTVARAVNTDKDIIKVGDLYYMCFDGVWFVGRGPNGPWKAADTIPKEIYEIPIESAAYNVTHVTVDSYDDDEIVYDADAAYLGMMVAWGCGVWGTGWYYPPYFWGGYYPGYIPRYPSYGYGASYNPWTGAFTRAGAAYGPYGGAGYAARYNPRTGSYSRGVAAWGPAGARGTAQAWNPRTGTAAQTRQGANAFGSWGSTALTRGDQWAASSRVTNRATGTTTRATRGSGGGTAVTRRGPEGRGGVASSGSGNIYAGRDGNVYRNEGGGWQKYENGSWNSTNRPEGTSGLRDGQAGDSARGGLSSTTKDQLNRDRAARSDAGQRTRDLGKVKSGGSGSKGAGSYRPSGGGVRAGGGGGRVGGGGFRGGGRR